MERFLGKHRRDDYAMLVSNLIKSYKKLCCRMSLKLKFLHFHLDFFRDNLGNVSKERGERFQPRYHSDGKTLSREEVQSHDGRLCMEFDAEKQHHIQAKKLFKCQFLINNIAVLLNCLFVSFFNFVCNILNYIATSFVLQT